jgi:hypothetical protein
LVVIVEDIAAIVERLRIVWIESYGFMGVGERTVEPTNRPVGIRPFAEGARISRIERDGAIKIFQRQICLIDVPVSRTATGKCRGERWRLILQRVDERGAGGDALLRRHGGFVGWGADRCIGAVLRLRRRKGARKADGESGNAAAHVKTPSYARDSRRAAEKGRRRSVAPAAQKFTTPSMPATT